MVDSSLINSLVFCIHVESKCDFESLAVWPGFVSNLVGNVKQR